ncbi:MAG: hypothetical protein K2W82_12695 [Candidatus Obscuribacterales bacterium]|nr:hypothetical protein [Candidatus Obscuribacterales bacterium]
MNVTGNKNDNAIKDLLVVVFAIGCCLGLPIALGCLMIMVSGDGDPVPEHAWTLSTYLSLAGWFFFLVGTIGLVITIIICAIQFVLLSFYSVLGGLIQRQNLPENLNANLCSHPQSSFTKTEYSLMVSIVLLICVSYKIHDVWSFFNPHEAGFSLLQEDRKQEAVESFSRAILWNPEHADAYRARGMVESYMGNHAAAFRDYSTQLGISKSTYDSELLGDLGWESLMLGNLGAADFYFKAAGKELAESYYESRVYKKSGWGNALARVNADLDENPYSYVSYYYRSGLLNKAFREKEAQADLIKAKQLLKSQFEWLKQNRALIYERANRGPAAATGLQYRDWFKQRYEQQQKSDKLRKNDKLRYKESD